MAKKSVQAHVFEAKIQVVTATTADLLPQAIHDALVDLTKNSHVVIGTNIVQPHHHDDGDHKAVVTYCTPPKTENAK